LRNLGTNDYKDDDVSNDDNKSINEDDNSNTTGISNKSNGN
jgi:hypothetical protein